MGAAKVLEETKHQSASVRGWCVEHREQRVHHVLASGLVRVFICDAASASWFQFPIRLASMIYDWRQATRAPLPCTAISRRGCDSVRRRCVESASWSPGPRKANSALCTVINGCPVYHPHLS